MIARMKRFHLFFTGDSYGILRKLQKEGIVEIDALPDSFGFSGSEMTEPEIENTFKKAEFLKNLLKSVESRDVQDKLLLTPDQEKNILSSFALDKIYEKFSRAKKESASRERIGKKILSIKKELLPLRELEVVPSDLFSMKNFSFLLFAVNKKQKNTPARMEGFPVEKIGDAGRKSLFLIIFPKEFREKVLRQIEMLGGETVRLRRWNRKVIEIIRRLDTIQKRNATAGDAANARVREILSYRNEILVFYDHVNTLVHYRKAREKLKTSKFVTGLTGWIKEKDVPRLSAFVSEILPDSYLHVSAPDESEENEIPIALENRKFMNPFEVVTDLYGKPVYRNIDPTAPLSLFFLISFAFCITDAAYGIILMALSLAFAKKFRLMPAVTKFMRLLLYGGAVTVLMGAITGSWFGDLLARIPAETALARILNRLVILNPLEGGDKTFMFLGWALAIGYVQIVWGLMLNLITSVRERGIRESDEALVLLLIQVLVAALILSYAAANRNLLPAEFIRVPGILLVISFIYLMIAKARTQKGPMMKAFWAVYGAYNVIAGNLLGDVLSYSRLFGLGLTTAVLGLVVNEIVFIFAGIPFIGFLLASVIFIAGHAGNMAINLMGGYIHTSRLQYLEFFTKFFESGGRPFSPFREMRNYTYLDNDAKPTS